MRIYIDESGNFSPGSAPSRICCVAALAVPEAFIPELLDRYVDLRRSWTSDNEIKGSSLSDDQTVAALRLLQRYDIVATIGAFDVGHHSSEQIASFQTSVADALSAGLTLAHNANVHGWVKSLCQKWLTLSPQLAAQLYVWILTIEDVIRNVPNYFAQRRPQELARFDWVVDPKESKQLTSFETVWQQLVCPILQTRSLADPFSYVEGFDYSSFDRFVGKIPDYLASQIKPGQTTRGAVDISRMLSESVAFPDSVSSPGLQLADIVASAFTKTMNGKLPMPVWALLGGLLIEGPRGRPPVLLKALGGTAVRIPVGQAHHVEVLNFLKLFCKPMFNS